MNLLAILSKRSETLVEAKNSCNKHLVSQKNVPEEPGLCRILFRPPNSKRSFNMRRIVTPDPAGPGTGKSATVVALIEQLLTGEPRPRIKLLTFTRAATAELANKVADHPTAATERPSTIHSFAILLLLKNPGAGGFPEPLRIADKWEQDEILHSTLAKRVGVTKSFLEKQLLPEMASGWENLDPVRFQQVDEQMRARFMGTWHEHRQIYGYTLLAELPYALSKAMRDNPAFVGLDYDLLIVDEYQDLNACDLEVLKLAAERGCIVIGTGDDDQSIYGFRWAAPEGIRRFLGDYPGAADYPLSVTQRCGSEIVRWANYVINGDPDRDQARASLRPAQNAPPGEVALLSFRDEKAEAKGVAALAHGLIEREGVSRNQVLVLLRGDYHGQFSKPIREQLTALGVPSFDPTEIDDLLADPTNRRMLEVLRLLGNPEDAIAWASLLKLTPGIGDGFAEYVYRRAKEGRISFGRALLDAFNDGFADANKATATRAKALVGEVQKWLGEHDAPEEAPDGWGRWIIDTAGGNVMSAPTAAMSTLLQRLDTIVEEQQDLSRFIGQIGPLGRDLMQTDCDGVRIMTMTSSKGLTVEATIIAGTEDGVVPRPHQEFSEERRLLYVAMTRAKKHLYCTWAQQRQGPTARAGEARVRGLRQVSHFLEGGPVQSQDGPAFVLRRFG